MNRFSASLLFCSATLALGALPAAHAQTSARFSGHILTATGQPHSAAVIRLVSDTTATPAVHPMRYTMIGDQLGKFSQEGVAPGAYLVMVFTGGKGMDVLRRIQLHSGEAVDLTISTGSTTSTVAAIDGPTDGRSVTPTRTR